MRRKTPKPNDYVPPLHVRREYHFLVESVGAAVAITAYQVLVHGVHLEVVIIALQGLHYTLSLREHLKVKALYESLHNVETALAQHADNDIKSIAEDLHHTLTGKE